MAVQVERVPLSRLTPAPWNPRLIRDARFTSLCASIEADPDFLEQRPILATSSGVIYAGHMRYRAVQHLGWADVPAILADVPEQLAKERALRDNVQWGEWQETDLATLLKELADADSRLDLLGFSESETERLLASISGTIVDDPLAEWQGMPEFQQEDADDVWKAITVKFESERDYRAFASLIQQDLTEQTPFIWYPYKPTHGVRGSMKGYRAEDES